MSASIWSPDGTIPSEAPPDYVYKRIWIDIEAGQTLVNFASVDPTFVYTPGLQSLEVGIDGGMPLQPVVDYTETSASSITLLSTPTDAGRLYAAVGRPIAPSISNLDASLVPYTFPDGVVRSVQDLATSLGTSGIVDQFPVAPAYLQTISQILQGERVSLFRFMINGMAAGAQTLLDNFRTATVTTDYATEVQEAFDAASIGSYNLYVPPTFGGIRCASSLSAAYPISIDGAGVIPYIGGTGLRKHGSWLYFDHTGIGININNAATFQSGYYFKNIGTVRNQPVPGPGWTPAANDFDFYAQNADITFDEVTLYNPTLGIKLTNTNAGRLTIKRLRGQPLTTGIDVDVCYDLPQISNVHFWPYWQDNTDVHAWTMGNLDTIFLRRVDNPQLVNIFSIFARAGIRITQSAAGSVSKLLLTNADFDRGLYGIWVDSTVTGLTSTKINNLSVQGETGLAGSKAIYVQGSNCEIQVSNFSTGYADQNGIRVEGSNNVLSLTNAEIKNYNQNGAGFPAIEVTATNKVKLAQQPTISGGGSGPRYLASGTGEIQTSDYKRSYTPTITTGAGTITLLGALNCAYSIEGDWITVYYDIIITTNGTGATDLRFTLPFTADISGTAAQITGPGRETAITGITTSATVGVSSTFAVITTATNTYPGGDGTRNVGSVRYKRA